MLSNFGKLLRKLRVDYGLTMRDIALKLNVSSSYISGIENGRMEVSSNFIQNLAKCFNLTKEELNTFQEAALNNKTSEYTSPDSAITCLQRSVLSPQQISQLRAIIDSHKENVNGK